MDSQRSQRYSENDLSGIILDSAIKVHRQLGPGLLESSYQACLAYELKKRNLFIESEKALPLVYEDVHLECGYRIDLFINRKSLLKLNQLRLLMMFTLLKFSHI